MNKAFPIAIILSTLFLLAYFILASSGLILSFEPGLSAGDISRWCERVGDGIFREPSNALSNLGFMVAGLYMFRVLSTGPTNQQQNTFSGLNKLSMLYAGAAIYLGPGSMLMHGTHTEWGQWADNSKHGYVHHLPLALQPKRNGALELRALSCNLFFHRCSLWVHKVGVWG